jgi:cytolysin-activating lysine-acyltransferase
VKSQQTFQDNRNYLGDILYLVAHSQMHHHFKMFKVKKIFLPPFRYGQYRLFYVDSMPSGLCTWAWVSDEVLERLQSGNSIIRPQDWRSGNNLWFADWISPFGRTREMVRSMRDFVTKNFGTNVKGQWIRSSKGKKGYAFSNKENT